MVKAQAIVDVMKRTFWKYKLKAWGMDEIRPITGGYQNTRYPHFSVLDLSVMLTIDKKWLGSYHCGHTHHDCLDGAGGRVFA